ncbi:hypothetical protein IL992_37795 [Microbispora sp. NEAU-D428]|uniref:hypothetical protein n=1 Tax=Microbispora sitophila TaxID=2771537 RepID=UPI001865CB00|nr:hypothetical protein [Microbispora sitophila]MBE3014885.1 hypothetical protein [Microbispora sitophila]
MPDQVIDQRCDDLYCAAETQDLPGFLATLQDLWERTEDSDPATADAVLVRLCGLFDRLPPGLGARLAVMGGAMVENGADPAPLVEPVVAGLCDALERSAEFARAWRAVTDRRLPKPDQEDQAVLGAARVLSGPFGLPGRLGLGRRLPFARALDLAVGWSIAEDWSTAATTVLQRSAAIRADLSRRPRLAAAVAALEDDRPDLWCLPRLLAVLDDEPLIVIHRPTGRAYAMTIGGIGDNFQLSTLLAHVLNGHVPVTIPHPSWVVAATDGPLQPEAGPIVARFDLSDATGESIRTAGCPADIPLLDGHRVVVLASPSFRRTWNIGRTYPMMRPSIPLDRVLSEQEARVWSSRVAPAP